MTRARPAPEGASDEGPAGAHDFLSADEAALRLGVQRATLYAYVSRGWLTSVPGDGRKNLYRRDEVERLRARSQARAGHEAVAAGALRWGEPVIASAITAITSEGPCYRGVSAVALAERGVAYESVAGLLWRGELDLAAAPWSPRGALGELRRLRAGLPEVAEPLAVLRLALAESGARDGAIGLAEAAEIAVAGGLCARMAALLGVAFGEEHVRVAAAGEGLAQVATRALLGRDDPEVVRAVEAALIVCADHELNASTFTARVIASTGADLHACMSGAAGALSGPLHGGMCARVEGLLLEAASLRSAEAAVRGRFARGEAIPGFGHPLYPQGDPRAAFLVRLAVGQGPPRAGLKRALAIAEAMAAAGHPRPTLDFGLVAITEALGLPRGAGAAIFAVGRMAGWIAHVFEQRRQGFLLRPTARYIGPGVEGGREGSRR